MGSGDVGVRVDVDVCNLVPRPPAQTLSKVWAGGLGTRLRQMDDVECVKQCSISAKNQ